MRLDFDDCHSLALIFRDFERDLGIFAGTVALITLPGGSAPQVDPVNSKRTAPHGNAFESLPLYLPFIHFYDTFQRRFELFGYLIDRYLEIPIGILVKLDAGIFKIDETGVIENQTVLNQD